MLLELRYIESIISNTASDSLCKKLVAAHNSFVNSKKDVRAWPYYGVNFVKGYFEQHKKSLNTVIYNWKWVPEKVRESLENTAI